MRTIWVQSTPSARLRFWIRQSPMATPISAPMMQCDEEFGMPKYQVSTFQKRAETKRETSIGRAGAPSGGVSTSGGRISTSA